MQRGNFTKKFTLERNLHSLLNYKKIHFKNVNNHTIQVKTTERLLRVAQVTARIPFSQVSSVVSAMYALDCNISKGFSPKQLSLLRAFFTSSGTKAEYLQCSFWIASFLIISIYMQLGTLSKSTCGVLGQDLPHSAMWQARQISSFLCKCTCGRHLCTGQPQQV
jgi:hypothetical protein